MSKSRYAKTKAAGAAVGLTRYGKLSYGKNTTNVIPAENRQMRRARKGK